jgi:hypothetical protein
MKIHNAVKIFEAANIFNCSQQKPLQLLLAKKLFNELLLFVPGNNFNNLLVLEYRWI